MEQITGGGSIVKLQKPEENTYTNIISKDGKNLGDCSICNCKEVDLEEHFCKTLIDTDELDMTNIYDTDPMIVSIDEFKKKLLRESSEIIQYNDNQILYFKKMFSLQHSKYKTNNFFKSIMSQLENKKQLSKKQEDQLKYLIKHGKSMYENNYLSTKN